MRQYSSSGIEIGQVVEGRYKILKLVGEGGMGTVFLAEHWLIKRRVALKILHDEYAADAEMLRRFMNEALAAGTLGHPNIVESTDMGFTKNDQPYIVFEYIEGTLLSDEIYRVAAFPIRRVLRIAFQIASALEAAHSAGIVHRDLKSDNIMITDRDDVLDHVKVLDFGISRFVAESDRSGSGGMLVGTPEFMAPEQVMDADNVDLRADIYALGVVLYEMLSGRLPFYLGTDPGPARDSRPPNIAATHALLHRILHDPPPPFSRRDAPAGLIEMVLDKLLAKDPARRYQSMKDVQGALEAFASVIPGMRSATGRPLGSPPAELGPEPPEPSEARTRRPADQTLSRSLLDPAMVAREVKQLGSRWSLVGHDLRLEVFSQSVAKLAAIVGHVGTLADEMQYQPTITVEPPRLSLTVRAYNNKAITVHDLVFAARLEQWLRETGWRG